LTLKVLASRQGQKSVGKGFSKEEGGVETWKGPFKLHASIKTVYLLNYIFPGSKAITDRKISGGSSALNSPQV